MNKQKGNGAVDLIVVLIGLAGVVGWIMNIVAIAGGDFSNITGMLVLRIVGIFLAPLGAVLGYL